VLCGHLACDLAGHRAVRAAGAAAIPLLTGTLYYTFSRGATAAAVVAVAAYVVVGRPRGLLAGALATVPTTLVAIMAVHPAGDLTGADPLAPGAVASGHRVALVVALCVLAAGVFRWLLAPVDTRIRELRLRGRISRRALAATGVAIFLAVLVGSVAVDAPGVAAQKYRDFNSDSEDLGNGGPSRLLSGSDNGRREHWHAALEAFRTEPLHGAGAGTYEVSWAKHRRTTTSARDGHSLYIESLGETGIVGLSLLLLCLVTILVAFAHRARGAERPLFAALLAAGLGWAVAASVDWVWEMPAVTLWLFALGGAALARRPRSEDGERASWRVPRGLTVALRVSGVAVCLLLAVLPARVALSEYHFDRSEQRMQAGDCAGARTEARAALRAQDNRAAPHHVLAFCAMRDRRWDEAAREFSLAVERDPHNWALRQGRAVARAAAGLSWRRDARLAVELNPLSEFATTSLRALTHASDKRRTARARSMEVALPELGDR
jgi:O-Antigen ligase